MYRKPIMFSCSKYTVFRMLPLVLAGGGAFIAWWLSLAPSPVPATAPAEMFSAERAHRHIAAVCTQPSPAGSLHNDFAFQYIQDELQRLGVEMEVIHQYDKTSPHQVSRRRAVLGRIRGTNHTRAFAMDAHFDSVPWGPGASDDWAGIAAMLETARALKASPPLRNDVIFVFADQEEFNMGGARAFRNHPWFEEVGVMLGLETRGSSGPALMFETSPNNGFVVRELGRARVGARTNSIMYDFYKRMPFNSDFDHYKDHVAGMNLAFINNFDHYHTVLDNPDNASLASIQHNGHYALGLARHFGNMALDDCYAPDAAYFNTLGGHLVVYPLSWGWPLAAASILLAALVFAYGFVSRRLSLSGTLAGFVILPIAAIMAAVPIGLVSYVIFIRFREAALYQNNVLSLGMVAVGLAIYLVVAALFRRWARPQEQLAGALVWWLAGLLVLQIMMPGGANLAMVPLVAGSIYLLVLLLGAKEGRPSETVLGASVVLALPGLMFIAPPLSISFYAITVLASVILVPLVILLTMFTAPQLHLLSRTGTAALAAIFAATGAALLVIGYLGCLPGPQSPHLNCLAYGVDFDAEEAWWLSSAREMDAWLVQYIPEGSPRQRPGSFLPYDQHRYLRAAAPLAADGPPVVNVLSDVVEEGRRKLALHVNSPRDPQRIWLRVESDTQVHGASVLGHDLEGGERHWEMRMEIMPREGVELRLETDPDSPLSFSLREMTYGLPELPGFVPRPDHMAPEPNRTLVRLPINSDITYSVATVDLGMPQALEEEAPLF